MGILEDCKRRFNELEERVRQASIPEDEVDKITNLSLADLVALLQEGHLKPSYVLAAYQTKALAVHKLTNCIIHPLEEAEEIALKLDKTTDRDKPLFGVPLSVKDDYALKSYTSALGIANLLDDICVDDCHMIKVLKDLGAVPFVKTNVPQMAFSYACSNPLSGETIHPHDPSRTPGGSSGGEAALLAAQGSVLGLGSDIGGSLRVPATFCGLYTIRPTAERMSHKGLTHSAEASGDNRIASSLGPMARDSESLVRFCRAVMSPKTYEGDMFVPPFAFREELYAKKESMRVGYYFGDELFPVTPASRRALLMAVDALRSQGHEVVEWTPPDVTLSSKLYLEAMCADSGKVYPLVGEAADPCVAPYWELMPGPCGWWSSFKVLFSSLQDKHYGDLRKKCTGVSSLNEYWAQQADIEVWRRDVERSFREYRLDSVICPSWPSCAPIRGQGSSLIKSTYMAHHCYVWIVLNCPSAAMPVTRVSEEDVVRMSEYQPDCAPWVAECIHEEISSGVGLPLGVQVAAMRWEEETVLRTITEIDNGLKKSEGLGPNIET